jgi:tetratricopeptide (TPR) repeat protein
MTPYVEALLQIAKNASDEGHSAEAAALLRLLIGRCWPLEADALALLGAASRRVGEMDSAEWLLQRALTVNPAHAWARAELGETLRLLGRPVEAVVHLEKAVAQDPSLTTAQAGLAAALTAADRPADALHWARMTLAAHTDRAEAHGLMGDVLARLGRTTEALAEYEKALAIRPTESRARYGRGLVRLELGDMAQGWPDHEARLEVTKAGGYTQKLWHGQKRMKRRTVLLHAEQGLSETIQFIRYAALVAKTGARIVVLAQRGIGRICATAPGVDSVIEQGESLPPFDLHCPLMSLPAVFRTTTATIPAAIPYLHADEFVRAEWRQTLKPWRKMRVGLAWQTTPDRSSGALHLAMLTPLLARPDIEWHAIQRITADDDRAALAGIEGLAHHTLALTDYTQAAGLIAEMDLVISADSPEAHLAGALGVPAWVMLAHHANWTWLRDRDDSPWYPGMRLFRQAHPGDWHSVLEQVAHNLDAWSVQQS